VLEFDIMKPEGIVVLTPIGALSEQDFSALNGAVDAYLAVETGIRGVLIRTKAFPGWASFAGFAAHIRFVHDHQKRIERVALVTDSPVADFAEALAKPFLTARIRHFPYAERDAALAWLKMP